MSNLTALHLGHNQLVGLPDDLSHLVDLRVLDLSSNKLVILPLLPLALTTLDLSRNNLTSLITSNNASFTRMVLLRHLDISYNQLTELEGGGLHMLASLQSLQASHNNIIRIPFGDLELPLRRLDLSWNRLNFSDNGQQGVSPEMFPLLEDLAIAGNVASVPSAYLGFPDLRRLAYNNSNDCQCLCTKSSFGRNNCEGGWLCRSRACSVLKEQCSREVGAFGC